MTETTKRMAAVREINEASEEIERAREWVTSVQAEAAKLHNDMKSKLGTALSKLRVAEKAYSAALEKFNRVTPSLEPTAPVEDLDDLLTSTLDDTRGKTLAEWLEENQGDPAVEDFRQKFLGVNGASA